MDKLTVKCETRNNSGYLYQVGVIYINGKKLIDVLKEIERKFVTLDRSQDLAGSYESMQILQLYNHLMFPAHHMYIENNKVSLLTCVCGEEACWPFLVHISDNDNEVIWSEYKQPYKTWDYSELKPLIFSKKEYMHEINNLLKSSRGIKSIVIKVNNKFREIIRKKHTH